MTFYSIVFGSIAAFLWFASSIKSVSTKMAASDNPMSNLKIPFLNFSVIQYLPYILLAGLGIYVLFNIIQLLKKPKKIDTFITQLHTRPNFPPPRCYHRLQLDAQTLQ
jgi:hypothetical protein